MLRRGVSASAHCRETGPSDPARLPSEDLLISVGSRLLHWLESRTTGGEEVARGLGGWVGKSRRRSAHGLRLAGGHGLCEGPGVSSPEHSALAVKAASAAPISEPVSAACAPPSGFL